MQRIADLTSLARRLPPRPTLVLHSGCSEPTALATLLAAQSAAFAGATLYCLMPMGLAPYAEPAASGDWSVKAFFPGKGLRAAVAAGRASVLRHNLSELPGLFDSQSIKAHALFLQVSPPDPAGRVSLGVAVDYMHSVLRQKPLVIAQINPRLPRTCGDSLIDVGSIDYFIESDESPQGVPVTPADAVDEQIAAYAATLVDDGAVLQVGIGSLPDRILASLRDRRNLGIHSGIITDAVVPLLESGVINNRTKHTHRGVSITSMAAGTQTFYDYLARNDCVEFHPCSLTHDAATLAAIDRLTAINSILQIDLQARANAEVVAGRVISAPGGLRDFARGASRAERGLSILALRSTFKEHSSIVGSLAADVPVTLEANDMDYVVTEFGIAAIRGKSGTERAEALIAVAHPAHQAALEREFASNGGM